MSRRIRFVAQMLFMLTVVSAPSLAGTIGLSWDPSVGASGYRVYFGSSPGVYDPTPLYEGPLTSTVLTDEDLAGCTTWHFAVTAYNSAGESNYSAPVSSWTRPEIQSSTPTSGMQGNSFTLTVSGESFADGALLQIDNPNVVLENASLTCSGCNCVYEVLATVEPMVEGVQPAQIGEFELTLSNLNGLFDSSLTFEVLLSEGRFDVNRSNGDTDGRLDGLDAAWISTVFGQKLGDSNYDPDYDFDGDGWVDGVDLAYLGSNFGECWNGVTWNASACE